MPSADGARTGKRIWWLLAPVAALIGLVLIAGGAGPALLGLLGAWAALFVVAWLVKWRTGGRTYDLATWPFEDGETVLWRDDRADIDLVPRMAQPALKRPLRLHRARVVVTTRRILVATPELFTRRERVIYVLYLGAAPVGADTRTFGGEFQTGYRTLVMQPGGPDIRSGERLQPSPYIALKPDPATLSSFNCAEFRIYTDAAATFRLPG